DAVSSARARTAYWMLVRGNPTDRPCWPHRASSHGWFFLCADPSDARKPGMIPRRVTWFPAVMAVAVEGVIPLTAAGNGGRFLPRNPCNEQALHPVVELPAYGLRRCGRAIRQVRLA